MLKTSTITIASLAIGISATATALDAAPVVLLNDTFSDGERSTQSLPSSAAWYVGTGGTKPTTDPVQESAGVVSGGKLSLTGWQQSKSVAATAYFTESGTPQQLAVGDKLSLSFTFIYGDRFNPEASGLRFGLYNSGGVRVTTDKDTDNAADIAYDQWGGYNVFAPLNTPASVLLMERSDALNNASETPITAGSNTQRASAAVATKTEIDTLYTVGLTVTRTLAGVDVEASFAGVPVSWSDATPYLSFDALHIFVDGDIADWSPFQVDDVSVTYTPVPEPTGFMAVGLTGMFALSRRSRKR